jgi:DNA polymerase-3 subunit beta
MKTTTFNAIKKVSRKNAISAIDKAVLITETSIIATDLQNWLKVTLTANWSVNGSGVITLDLLKNTVNAKSVKIDFNDLFAIITVDGRTFKTSFQSASDFPESPNSFNMITDGQLIAKDIAGVLDFIGKDDLRPAMLGAYIGADICGTNGHILRYIKSDYGGKPFILPKIGVELVKANLKDVEKWSIKQDDEYACLYANGIEITSRKIDETYPNYKSVIPQDNPGLITFDKNELQKTLKTLDGVINKHTNLIEFNTVNNSGVTLKVNDIDLGTESEQELSADVSGFETAFRIGFNSKLLQTVCSNIASDLLSMELSTPTRAGVVNNEILIMPVKLWD